MRNPRELKLRLYADYIIDLNEYLTAFTGAKASDEIGETKLNTILLNSMPNGQSQHGYTQGFDFKSIDFLKGFNMFEHMQIADL